ncbi:hypothetical protein K490DRAFT_57402 [Saccharata proteae CBS 121410]|uniref:Uncharacterized protein n=1 Tax=Saccharata proteae CBS 121410 TaxID=1314787 RepID=A0A9P4HS22_9PEZI|nr:hypothetical protein K490DRAFT_57402 [Saccharata proteae CBS 121410]
MSLCEEKLWGPEVAMVEDDRVCKDLATHRTRGIFGDSRFVLVTTLEGVPPSQQPLVPLEVATVTQPSAVPTVRRKLHNQGRSDKPGSRAAGKPGSRTANIRPGRSSTSSVKFRRPAPVRRRQPHRLAAPFGSRENWNTRRTKNRRRHGTGVRVFLPWFASLKLPLHPSRMPRCLPAVRGPPSAVINLAGVVTVVVAVRLNATLPLPHDLHK